MEEKTYLPSGEGNPSSQIGATLETLQTTIAARREAQSPSYTHELLTGDPSYLLGKLNEEAQEVVEAACEDDVDHLRYEAADVLYHLLVILERYNISLDELAAELNMRMSDNERPEGGLLLYDHYVKRGK